MLTSQPCLIARVNKEMVKDCFLIIEKHVVCKLGVDSAIFVLFASFYVFNLHYSPGCTNFYLLLESLFLQKKIPGRKPRIAALYAELTV